MRPRVFPYFRLGVVERGVSADRTCFGRPVPWQSFRLVSWAGRTRRSVLIPSARGTYSFSLAMGNEGQWKGMSLTKDPGLMRDNRLPGRISGSGNEGTVNRD